MEQARLKMLRGLADRIRRDVIRMIGCKGQVGHLGGSCSSADIVAALYGHRLRHDPQNPDWPGRDRFIYSKGHAAIAQYAAMAETGYFPVKELETAKNLGSRLQGHPDRLKTPGIEAGTGSLGQGLSIAGGMAMGLRLNGERNQGNKVFCILGDGELGEGQVWEAALSAAHYKLDNLCAIVDVNRLQATGPVVERLDTNPLPEKWQSFGWHVLSIDGHDMEAILSAFEEADRVKGKPTVILAQTVKGKGVSFAENMPGFHNGPLSPKQYDIALQELDACIAACTCEGGE